MALWQKENSTDNAIKVILFVFLPVLSFVYSLRSLNTKTSFIVFFLCAVLFGMAYTVPSGPTVEIGVDGAYYRLEFDNAKFLSEVEFLEGWNSFLNFDEGKKDYYFETVSYYLSRFTDNYHVMFMVLATVFAFFSLKSFKFFTEEIGQQIGLGVFILAYMFMYNQIFNINGVRFWTATWIGVYAIFQIFKNNKKQYWLLVLVTPYFHGSFWIFIGVLILAELTRRFEKTWVILFGFSFVFSNIAIEFLQSYQDTLPAFMSGMVNDYTDAEYVKSRNEVGIGYGFIPHTFDILMRIYQALLIFLFIKNSKQIRSNNKTNNLYLFLLVWASVFNFFAFVPSLGVRFNTFVWPLIAYIWLVNFKQVKYKEVLYGMPLVFAWNFFTMFGYYNMVLTWDFYISSPVVLIFKYLIIG
ncbi:EpsG family protein [Kaistella rhinocerotis]|uniref:EpsG family protein n=1 Tax=Kaistella rhinocerotis TaxID=3026437 RepID=UPI0025551549|nr:EpsG family protein [Kaistella sp. Ran72]